MPVPHQDESEGAFVDRCMGDPEAMRTAPEQDQRAALCHSLYREHKKMMDAGVHARGKKR